MTFVDFFLYSAGGPAFILGVAMSHSSVIISSPLKWFIFNSTYLIYLLKAQLVKNAWMQETQVWSRGQEDPLEKEMATHSSILVWRIPRTEEPVGLQSMGSQRVRHDSLSLLPLTNVHLLIITCIIVHQKFWQPKYLKQHFSKGTDRNTDTLSSIVHVTT